jgi:putative ubiquitin-RnfH superfamily antitoxin RatB of RatAB toxin-antitoxin module
MLSIARAKMLFSENARVHTLIQKADLLKKSVPSLADPKKRRKTTINHAEKA